MAPFVRVVEFPRSTSTPGKVADAVLMFVFSHYIFWWVFFVVPLVALWKVAGPYVGMTALCLYFSPLWFFNGASKGKGMLLSWLYNSSAFRYVNQYCNMTFAAEAELPADRPYLFCFAPHGILCVHRIGLLGHTLSQLFPGVVGRFAAASPQFMIPGCREVCLWLGALDANRKTLDAAFDRNESVLLWPGGSKEIFLTDVTEKSTTLYINDRKGFVKLAMRKGVDLVPVFVFGEQRVVTKLAVPGWQKFLKWTKIPLVLFWGRYFTWLPRVVDDEGRDINIKFAFGAPIPVEAVPEEAITQERIDALHAEYVKQVVDLFERHKVEYGGLKPDHPLTLI
eukprot:CAMPEP_0119119196 /NCGR_PEP_ID=MMETSP1310-20130426/790_1 /TAXON_ID=464262 /ORGANISM="Genus nov. species nov., Strain RCC2339" /LENGTH=337 /DNA_ID=CAMNT_0007108615 /DNA_START=365 /DNA_END=1378 /DNA_ORIENTATION=-